MRLSSVPRDPSSAWISSRDRPVVSGTRTMKNTGDNVRQRGQRRVQVEHPLPGDQVTQRQKGLATAKLAAQLPMVQTAIAVLRTRIGKISEIISQNTAPRACLPMIWGVGGDDRAYDAFGSDFG